MKSLIMALALALSSMAYAGSEIESSKGELEILSLVVGVKQTYSKTSELEAKVVEILAGDGMNASRMVLVLNTGYHDVKVFELSEMMVEVKRVTFLAKDLIVINYTQDSFDENENQVVLKKSVTIKVNRNADNTLADSITIVE